jgi:hypothetical protein
LELLEWLLGLLLGITGEEIDIEVIDKEFILFLYIFCMIFIPK